METNVSGHLSQSVVSNSFIRAGKGPATVLRHWGFRLLTGSFHSLPFPKRQNSQCQGGASVRNLASSTHLLSYAVVVYQLYQEGILNQEVLLSCHAE